MTATVGFTSAKSLGICVSMVAGFNGTHDKPERRCFDGYMTFVALDAEGKPRAVPQLSPETPTEVARFREGQLRREFRRKLDAGELPATTSLASVDAKDRPLLVREILKVLPGSFRLPWERDVKPRRRHASYMHSIELARTGHLNFHGTLYGGTLMRWLEYGDSLGARARRRGGGANDGAARAQLHSPRPSELLRSRALRGSARRERRDDRPRQRARRRPDERRPCRNGARIHDLFADGRRPGRPVPPVELTNDEDRALKDEVDHRLSLQRVIDARG